MDALAFSLCTHRYTVLYKPEHGCSENLISLFVICFADKRCITKKIVV